MYLKLSFPILQPAKTDQKDMHPFLMINNKLYMDTTVMSYTGAVGASETISGAGNKPWHKKYLNIRYSFKCRPLCIFSKDHKIQRYIDGTYIRVNGKRKYVRCQSPECLFHVLCFSQHRQENCGLSLGRSSHTLLTCSNCSNGVDIRCMTQMFCRPSTRC